MIGNCTGNRIDRIQNRGFKGKKKMGEAVAQGNSYLEDYGDICRYPSTAMMSSPSFPRPGFRKIWVLAAWN